MPPEPPLRFPHDRPLPRRDRSYWLARCEGFRVDTPAGRLGTVAELRFGRRVDVPDLLAVRIGHLRHRLVLVPVGEVESIDADARVLRLRAAAAARPRGAVASTRQG